MTEINWGPSGKTVYQRTYSRTKPDGSKETWPETVERVAEGNLALVYGPCDENNAWPAEAWDEYDELVKHMLDFRIIPAGRHLWASGVKGRQYLMNCWTSGWGEKLSDHFEFTFLRLMEGGGVGANYSSHYLEPFGAPRRQLAVHIVCDPGHPDYQEMLDAELLSDEYDADWEGAFEVEDSREGWAAALVDLIDTYMSDDEVKHSNRVYDVSRVRAKGSRLKTFGGTASGPAPFARMMNEVSYVLNGAAPGEWNQFAGEPQLTPIEAMELDHAIAECVVSGGVRRSARMSIVRWDDPYILDFINCKQDTGKHWTTNISVEVDDDFFRLLDDAETDAWAALESMVPSADEVHEAVLTGMLTNGEPGYWNSSLSNDGELEPVYATNPCGEITLQPWEACNLGHVNLDAFHWSEMPELKRAHVLMTRFLIRATYADINDPKSREIQDKNRRIGVGHLGVQGHLVKAGIRYSEAAGQTFVHGQFMSKLAVLQRTVRDAARDYSFQLRIPEPVKVTTVAPTGSIAKLPGATEGIHPIYSRYFIQRIRFSRTDPAQLEQVADYEGLGFVVEVDQYDPSGNTYVVEFPTKNVLLDQVEAGRDGDWLVEQADELSVDQMLAFQAMYQRAWADNAVSFTVNVPEGLSSVELDDALRKWLPHLKGTTIMVDGSRPQAPFERISREQYRELIGEIYPEDNVGDSIDMECATGACPIR